MYQNKGVSSQRKVYMPQANFGEKLDFSASKFTKLKSKGDMIQFRIIKAPHYDGQHFLKDDEGNWDVRPCIRINDKEECEFCEMFFGAHASAKKEGLSKEETFKLTDPWKPSINFYYPVINRDTQKFEIFQTTKSVRDAVEAEIEMGTKVLKKDIIVLRTEKPGNYYKFSMVDSADTLLLTKEEKAEFKKGEETDLGTYLSGSEEEDSKLAIEVNSEEVEEILT